MLINLDLVPITTVTGGAVRFQSSIHQGSPYTKIEFGCPELADRAYKKIMRYLDTDKVLEFTQEDFFTAY